MTLIRDQRGPTKRTLNAIETKKRIFETAIHLFAEHGYESVTIDDITRQAGVSKGNYYTHFESKDAVLVEQYKLIDEVYENTMKEMPPELTCGEKILRLVDSMCKYSLEVCGINVIKVVYSNQISLGPKTKILTDDSRTLYRAFDQIVQEGIERVELRDDLPPKYITTLLTRSCRAILYDWCLSDGELPLRQEAQQYFKCILTGLIRM